MSELIRKMAAAHALAMNPVVSVVEVDDSDMDAMRAALAVLADNVTGYMVAMGVRETSHPGWTFKKVIAAAIREAGK